MKKKKIYAYYRGDEFVAVGTVQEIAKQLNLSVETIYFYIAPSSKGKRGNVEVIRLEDESDDNYD